MQSRLSELNALSSRIAVISRICTQQIIEFGDVEGFTSETYLLNESDLTYFSKLADEMGRYQRLVKVIVEELSQDYKYDVYFALIKDIVLVSTLAITQLTNRALENEHVQDFDIARVEYTSAYLARLTRTKLNSDPTESHFGKALEKGVVA